MKFVEQTHNNNSELSRKMFRVKAIFGLLALFDIFRITQHYFAIFHHNAGRIFLSECAEYQSAHCMRNSHIVTRDMFVGFNTKLQLLRARSSWFANCGILTSSTKISMEHDIRCTNRYLTGFFSKFSTSQNSPITHCALDIEECINTVQIGGRIVERKNIINIKNKHLMM